MELGFEIKAHKPIHIKMGNSMETVIIADGKIIHNSYGFDQYLLPISIIPGHRLAATGRTASYELANPSPTYRLFNAKPHKKIRINPDSKIKLAVISNIPTSFRFLPHCFTLLAHSPSGYNEINLTHPRLVVEKTDANSLIIDLTYILALLKEKERCWRNYQLF